MNEKIRELADEAGAYVNEVYTPPVRSKTPGKMWENGHVDWHEQFNDKFAELIVRECAEICEKYAEAFDILEDRGEPADFFQGGVKSASRRNANAIKQHFGVEE